MISNYICPVCSSRRAGQSQKYQGRFPVFDEVKLVECCDCGAWSAFPVISQESLSILYEESYWTQEIYNRRLIYLEAQMRARCEFIQTAKKFSGNLKILDVGASVGVFNRVAGQCFGDCSADYYGVEVNGAAIKFLEGNCDKSHILQTIDEAPGTFQLIILSHFLEHIASPRDFLQLIREKLTRGGTVFIEVPNCDFRFKPYHQPHMVFYNISSLQKLIEQSGFRCLRIDSCGRKVKQMQVEANLGSYNFFEKVGKFLTTKLASLVNSDQCIDPAFGELESYGGDRRWLRLVADRVF